jgi:hypothetical protein
VLKETCSGAQKIFTNKSGVSGGLQKYLRDIDSVRIVTLESFIALVNEGRL